MSGKAFTRLFVALVLVLGMATVVIAGPKKQATDKASGSAVQTGKSDSDRQKGKQLTPSESHQPVDPSQYVGAETCKTCHEEQAKSYDSGPHWKTTLDKHKGPEWQGCEACHGPGKEHAESADPSKIIRFGALSREESSRRCLTCHEFGAEHSNFLRSQHLKNNVGCVDCHSVHSPKVNRELLKAAQPALCYSCHLEVKPDFSKPFHHRVNEGLINCSDCHNQHGGFMRHQLRSTAAEDVVCPVCCQHARRVSNVVHVGISSQ